MKIETARLQRVNEILLATLERATRERPSFLAEVCGEDEELRQGVESLLAGDGAAASDLSRPAFGSASGAEPELGEGDGIGPYHVLRKLGQGGMGAVYLAERADGEYTRRGAVKILRPGMATEGRFRVERQILANLDHPGIARLLEGGTTEEGRPYLVMEYVEGEPIDRYCRDRRLSIRQRLRLFRQVCSAVEFAHRNLVVHRDLKPSNILVTAAGEAKLLDFGIAKLLDADSHQPLTVTDAGLRPMTPDYASPEQVRGEPITTASDVYSLGVLLYELLTGQRPYGFETHRLEEVCRVVCETEPERPSQTPVEGRRRLQGDLDNIVLMALSKQPRQRYSSVEQFSDDLRRHLDGRPVRARKNTFFYRTGKFLRRHRAKMAAAALGTLVLVAGVLDRERRRGEVVRQRDRAERVTGFLVELFKISDPNEARANSVTVREMLDRGAAEIHRGLEEDPELRAALMATMGRVYLNLGLYEPAAPLLEQALETRRERYSGEHPSVLESLMELADLYRHQEAFGKAEPLVRQVLTIQLELLGRNHPDVAQSIHNLGALLVQQGKYNDAEASLRQALTLKRELFGRDHPDVIESLNNIVVLLILKGDLDAAEPLAYEVLELRRRHYEEDHPLVLMDLFNLANLHHRKGDYKAMLALCQEGLRLSRQRYGRHPQVAEALDNVGVAHHSLGDLEQAEAIYREALSLKSELLGDHHPKTARTMVWLAELRLDLGDPQAASTLTREALVLLKKALGDQHPEVARVSGQLALLLSEQGEFRQAEALYQETLDLQRKLLDDDHPHIAKTLTGLAALRLAEGEPAAAEPLVREALDIYRGRYKNDHWRTAEAESVLGACLAGLGRGEEADLLLSKSHDAIHRLRGERSFVTRQARERLRTFHQAATE